MIVMVLLVMGQHSHLRGVTQQIVVNYACENYRYA